MKQLFKIRLKIVNLAFKLKSMNMRTICILLFFFQLITGSDSLAQDNSTDSTWQKVEIRIIESRKTVNKLNLAGEAMLKITSQIKQISDLSEEQVKELKKRAAKDNCKFVYIDTKGVYDSQDPNIPTLYSKGKLYYYWANKK